MNEPTSVLDASALLAYLQNESGADVVQAALVQGAAISTVNWAEVLSKLAQHGQEPDIVVAHLSALGLLHNAIQFYPLDTAHSLIIAKLFLPTRSIGLSLGDRACLALALSLGLPALTADQDWRSLSLSIPVIEIRAWH